MGVIIGSNGETKRLIEDETASMLRVNSEEGVVDVSASDSINEMNATEIVKAIARGFSPERAFRLLDDDMVTLEVIRLPADDPKKLRRMKGRIIGKNGRTREIMENLTGAAISVYGKTVSAIGYADQTSVVAKAVDMLVGGSPHGPVYAFLERKRSEVQ